MAKKNAAVNGLVEVEGRVVSTIKVSVPADATMEQKLQAVLDTFKGNVEANSTVSVKYSSTAQCQQLKEIHAAGRFVQTESGKSVVVVKPTKPEAEAPETTPAPEAKKEAAPKPEAKKTAKPAEAKKEAAPKAEAKKAAKPAEAKKALSKTDKKLLDNKKVRAATSTPNAPVRDKRAKQIQAAAE